MWYKIKLTIAVLALTLFGNISTGNAAALEQATEVVITQAH